MQPQACKNIHKTQVRHSGYLLHRRPALVALMASLACADAEAAPPAKESLQDKIDQCKPGGKLSVSGERRPR